MVKVVSKRCDHKELIVNEDCKGTFGWYRQNGETIDRSDDNIEHTGVFNMECCECGGQWRFSTYGVDWEDSKRVPEWAKVVLREILN